MVKTITIFVEGGGDDSRLKAALHKGFRNFFKKLDIDHTKIKIAACGGRSTAFKHFRSKIKNIKEDEFCLLLVDSEAPVKENISVWQHVLVRESDKWQKPDNASEEHLHFMVECMETWFMADKQTLADYYGQGFNQNALKNTDIESISKHDLYSTLNKATRNTTKSGYSKGEHSFKILSQINANAVIAQSPYAKRLYDTLKKL